MSAVAIPFPSSAIPSDAPCAWEVGTTPGARDAGDEPADVVPLRLSKNQTVAYRRRLFVRSPECVYCGKRVPVKEATTEHAVPRSEGGPNAPWNLWLACRSCNEERCSKPLTEWAAELRLQAAQLIDRANRIRAAGRRMGTWIEVTNEGSQP